MGAQTRTTITKHQQRQNPGCEGQFSAHLENEHALKVLPSVKGLRDGLSGVIQLVRPSCQHLDYSLTLSVGRVYADRLFVGIHEVHERPPRCLRHELKYF